MSEVAAKLREDKFPSEQIRYSNFNAGFNAGIEHCAKIIEADPQPEQAKPDVGVAVVEHALRYARHIAPTPAAVELYDKALVALAAGIPAKAE